MVAAKIELIQAELLKSHKSNLINEYGNKNGGNDGGLDSCEGGRVGGR